MRPSASDRNVRVARKHRRLSQEQLSFDAGKKRSLLSDLERGTRDPSVRAIERSATALQIEPWTFLRPPDA
ncbi:helix-turn-helix transcriptional regulator [Phenylobacterium sp.]|uniref:helix-turn-helix domain-containing protein n=1 Tax=Phenylobacterium sp. TaxID=1871053 RepID=UPI00286C2547|nr:helix-turn-helix transcriptional regulator [Phenylobacterium sp.]